jgi:uroporphyrinogen decarboxylase
LISLVLYGEKRAHHVPAFLWLFGTNIFLLVAYFATEKTVLKPRDRFIRAVHFEEADRAPHAEQFWLETLEDWYTSGSLSSDYGTRYLNLPFTQPTYEGAKYDILCRLYEMDMYPPWNANSYFYPTDFSPMFQPEVIEKHERWTILKDEWGNIKKVRLDGRSVPQLIDFPVKNPEDLSLVEDRLDPYDPRRFKVGWGERAKKALKEESAPIGWGMVGFFSLARYLFGQERALLAFLKYPWLIRHIFDFWANFIIALAKPALEVQVDYLGVWEDLAYKNGPMISPQTFTNLMVPYYKRVTNAFKKRGVDVVIVDSDGNIDLLIPLWLEAGVNGFVPLEAQSGMYAPSLREKYGDKVVLMGNISLGALREGPDAIDEELRAKLPALLPGGGYIISTDHHVPPDVPYQNYLHYVKRILKWGRYTTVL